MFLYCYTVCNKRDLGGVPGVFIRELFVAHEGFEAADLFAGTEDDEGITGVDLVLGRGVVSNLPSGARIARTIAPVFSPILSSPMVWLARGDSLGTLNSSILNSRPFSPRVTMSRKSTMRGWVAREASLRPPTA